MRDSVICVTLITLHMSIVLPNQYVDQYEESVTRTLESEQESSNEVYVSEMLMHEPTRSTTQQAFARFPPSAVISSSALRSKNNIDCDNFVTYAVNCTEVAGIMYGSSRKAPPMADKLQGWCNALIHLTNCASDWNEECKHVAENHFDPYSLEGHIHVVDNVCLDNNFTLRYRDASSCIEDTTFEWEFCYAQFKDQIDEMKNSSLSWTHYQTHFTLCCARANFRACTLEFLFTKASCTRNQAITMQRFSVIISEGDVHQDCEKGMNYANCPGGDPHPKAEQLLRKKGVIQNTGRPSGDVNSPLRENIHGNIGNRNSVTSVPIVVFSLLLVVLRCCSFLQL